MDDRAALQGSKLSRSVNSCTKLSSAFCVIFPRFGQSVSCPFPFHNPPPPNEDVGPESVAAFHHVSVRAATRAIAWGPPEAPFAEQLDRAQTERLHSRRHVTCSLWRQLQGIVSKIWGVSVFLSCLESRAKSLGSRRYGLGSNKVKGFFPFHVSMLRSENNLATAKLKCVASRWRQGATNDKLGETRQKLKTPVKGTPTLYFGWI